jgi:peroxiredoxin Q/BCP
MSSTRTFNRRHVLGIAALGVAVAGGAFALSCGAPRRPDGGRGLLPAGATAPDLEARDASDRVVRLSELRGKSVVVYFYPKDETPGCTKEACAFRDAWNKYAAAGVAIVGVSRDSVDSHRAFLKHHALPFPLVADEKGTAQEAYGVSSFLGMSSRVSFLVGPDGKVTHVWPDVDPAVHADEVLAAAAR